MDIIPIIYTVLIIVIILTVFTLTYSFYSFNHKQKKHSTSTTDQSSKINESRKELIVEKKVLAIPSKPKIELKKKNIEEKIDLQKINVDSKEQKSISKKEPQKIVKPNKRVKILNLDIIDTYTVIKKNPKPNQIKKTREKLETLGNEILDKYTDENENDLFTLKVNEQPSKPKK